MQRPPNIQTERLVLVALLPEDIEALLTGGVERTSLMTGDWFLISTQTRVISPVKQTRNTWSS